MAPGMRAARVLAVCAVPVAVDTVKTGPVFTASPFLRNVSASRSVRVRSTGKRALPKPSRSTSTNRPSAVSAPRSATTISVATRMEPMSAMPGKAPPIPALMTQLYFPSASMRAVPAAAAAEPTPATITSAPSPGVPANFNPRRTASASASTAVTIKIFS